MSHLDPERIELAAKSAPAGDDAAHLASCAECKAQVKSARARQRLLGGMTPYTLSDMAFRRVEARLDEAVAAGDASPRSWRWAWLLGGALAVAVLGLVLINPEGTAPWTVKLPTPQVAAHEAPFHPLAVLKAAPDTQLRDGKAWSPVRAGDVLSNAGALSSTQLLAAPEADVPWSLALSGSFSIGGAASITLGAGEVVAEVKSPIEVLAASRRVLASESLFAVERTGAEVVLHVASGDVEVVDTVTAERRTVKAPAALRWGDGTRLEEGRAMTPRELGGLKLPARPWTRLDATTLPAGTQVSLDGVSVGVAPFVELVTAGRRLVGLTPPGGTQHERWAELIKGVPYAPTATVTLPEAEEREPDAEALQRVMGAIKQQTPKLAACYEKWLKTNRTAEGELVLELLVSAKGRVTRATVESGSVPPASSECLVRTAKTLVLPPLGVDATLQVPLVLRPH